MTAANGSSDSTSTTPDGGPAIQLQPTPPTPTLSISSEAPRATARELSRTERLVGEIRLLDRALVILTLGLAFFLASFRAAFPLISRLPISAINGPQIGLGNQPPSPFNCGTVAGWGLDHRTIRKALAGFRQRCL